jgi:dTDP-4-amino-4,6-dideoxygalactose transaminase
VLNRLIPFVSSLKERHPKLYTFVLAIARRFLGRRFGVYPRIMGDEVRAVTGVLRGSQWNMAYGKGLAHERLEADFADFVGVREAVAVGSGGVALQMSLRVLGVEPGDEVIHQVDTCSATAMAVMNAGGTPIFADIAQRTFMLDESSIRAWQSPATKALIATHMWGNPESMGALRGYAAEHGWKLVEDACLALGAVVDGRSAGSWGDLGVFSFGCIKPIQGGEGGMIATNDSALAKELRAMRHWGDRTIEFGVRDVTELSWNGRMSELVAAVVREQLRGYPRHLADLRDAVAQFSTFVGTRPGLGLVLGNSVNVRDSAFTQIVLRLDEELLGLSKQALFDGLRARGVAVWHANFEPINTLSLFRQGIWRKWIKIGDVDRVARNYASSFPSSELIFSRTGLGLGKMNFLSSGNFRHLVQSIDAAITHNGTR